MSNEPRNHSEETITFDDKRSKLVETIKSDRNNNYGSYAALIGMVLTISGIILKGISTIVIEGYNNYFSINSSYNHISEANVFSNLFDILFGSIILLALNFLMAYVIIRAKNIWKLVRNIIFICALSMISLFIFACIMLNYNFSLIWKQATISDVLSCLQSLSILCISIYYFGLTMGIAIRNMKWFDKSVDKVISTIDKKTNAKKNSKKIIIILLVFLVVMGAFCFFKLGESFAALKHDYRLTDNNTKVILAEKDGMYLCADCKYDESTKQLEIYSSEQVCINSEDVEMRVINVYSVSIYKGN